MDKKNNFCPIQVETIPFRLTIGVIGHSNAEKTHKKMMEIIDEILKKYSESAKHTQITPCILSSLFDETGRLAFEESLKNQNPMNNVVFPFTLNVVLPLNESDYIEDFQHSQVVEQFKKQSESVILLREKSLKEEYPTAMLQEARKQAYQDADRYIVNYCDILIAVDCDPELENYAKKRQCPIYIIHTNKSYESAEANTILLKKIDKFNSHICPIPQDKIDKKFNELLKNFQQPYVAEIQDSVKTHLTPYHIIASDMAKRSKKEYHNSGIFSIWLAFAAVLIVSIGVIFLGSPKYIFYIEIFIFFIIFYIYLDNKKRKKPHKKWMEYRFFTERLRSAFYLTVCGVETSSVPIDRHVQFRNMDVWMFVAFEEIRKRLKKLPENTKKNCNLIGNNIVEVWIDKQIEHHNENIKKYEKWSKWVEHGRDIVFYAAVVVAIFHLCFHSDILTLLSLILPALAGTLEAHHSIKEYKRLTIHSKKMIDKLEKIKDSFKLLTDEKLTTLLKQTEELMLKEVQDWQELVSFAEMHKAV